MMQPTRLCRAQCPSVLQGAVWQPAADVHGAAFMCMPSSLGCAEADCLPCPAVLQGAAEQDVEATVAFENEDCHETQLQNVSTADGQAAGAVAPSAGNDDGTASPANTAAPTPLPTAGETPHCCLLVMPSATLGGPTSAGAGHSPVASTCSHLPGLSCVWVLPTCMHTGRRRKPFSEPVSRHLRNCR